ncbi:MAG: hypothetical protein SFX73_38725 [Kofleriaceae bacterium]|nr:hypothetical protein [Kofleriaceae bacterium]
MKHLRALFLVVAGAMPACLDVPEAPDVECSNDTQCDQAHGEICDEGTCWGNPPMAAFAAVISPPGDRNDLVPRELTSLAVASNGWIEGLQLESPVTLSGRIEGACPPAPQLCDTSTIEATITVTRRSSFPGGPGFRTVVMSSAGATDASFSVPVPPHHDGDEPYIVTVMPAGRDDEPPMMGTTPAQLVPPARIVVTGTGSEDRTTKLGGIDNPIVEGTLLSATGNGLGYHRVVAMGRWDENEALTEVSTVAYTGTDGKFRLTLAANLTGSVEIVAKPYADLLEPTLRLEGVPATSSSQRTLVQPAGLGLPKTITVPITGTDGSGAVNPVRGARVRVTATLGALKIGDATATFTAEGTTNDAGNVELEVLDGPAIASRYRLEVVPQAAAKVGIVFDQPLESYAVPLQLPSRVAMTGVVTDAEGTPLKDVAVTARPSLRFLWNLDDIPQSFLAGIPAATTTTSEAGEYVLWVDPMILGTWGRYDLVFEPAGKSRSPAWVKPDVAIPDNLAAAAVTMTQVQLPDAAFLRGNIKDPNGVDLEAAELKVFRLTDDAFVSLCAEVRNEPANCPIPATLQGRGTSDKKGVVRLTLPR